MIGLFILGCILAFAAVFVFPFKRDADGLKLTFGLLAVGSALIVLPMVSIYGCVSVTGGRDGKGARLESYLYRYLLFYFGAAGRYILKRNPLKGK